LPSVDGLAVASGDVVGVGVGVSPPTHPQAMMSTVPTIDAWTSQRGFGQTSFLIMVQQPYDLGSIGATVSSMIDAES
jgi:hypothetical protein